MVSQVLGVNVSFLDYLKGILRFQCKWIKHCYLLSLFGQGDKAWF